MTTLYIIRHGQTVANIENRIAGRADFPLTDVGRAQAVCTANFLKDTPLDAVLTSPLCRAKETAEKIAESHGLPLTVVPDLAEVNFGKLEGMLLTEAAPIYPDVLDAWHNHIADADFPGGERMREVAVRAEQVVCDILAAYPDKSVCLVTHGALIKFILAYIKNMPLEELDSVHYVNNASVTTVAYENGKFTVLAENQSEHMGKLVSGIPNDIFNFLDEKKN